METGAHSALQTRTVQYGSNYYGTYVNNTDIIFKGDDIVRTTVGDGARTFTSGTFPINTANIAISKELDWALEVSVNSGIIESTDFDADGECLPSGLSNTTVGRFSGSSLSGVYSAAGNYFSGYVYEIVAYDRQLLDNEVAGVRQYLFDKWDIG